MANQVLIKKKGMVKSFLFLIFGMVYTFSFAQNNVEIKLRYKPERIVEITVKSKDSLFVINDLDYASSYYNSGVKNYLNLMILKKDSLINTHSISLNYQPDLDIGDDSGNGYKNMQICFPEISPPKKVWVIPNEEKNFSFTLQTLENVETIIKGKNYTSTTWYFPLRKGEKYTMQVSLKLETNGKEEIFYSNKVTFRYK